MLDAVAAESALVEIFLDHLNELVVDDILEPVVLAVVDVQVLESVDVEVHLVVGAQPVMVYAEHGHVREYVVHGSHGDLDIAAAADFLCHHVRRCMSEFQHRFVYRKPLGRSFQRMHLKDILELFYIRFL